MPEDRVLCGFYPRIPGAHSQGETLDELRQNIEEVIGMLLEDGEPGWNRSSSAFRKSPSLDLFRLLVTTITKLGLTH
uniref:Type II toxin-antitoxin system HicB family antitoxin n=1 Tax=Candidatus Kentrum sp. MB TaxID=2138164 RepID=A0A450XZ76_9GAMM|nr:MAG: hypothetical protein BECKMB1821I_GA0114274_107710 [Candidatus Kentron sp. MB]VFK76863.1 MAG: hypothetical protein BECKMB1821H_GA0114242_107914 [Candidatus Kentron sp. MB]